MAEQRHDDRAELDKLLREIRGMMHDRPDLYEKELGATPTQLYFDHMRQVQDRRAASATDNLRATADEIKKTGFNITPEFFTDRKNYVSGLDPSFVYLTRAIAGSAPLTPEVLQKVRDSWCQFDLPQRLFEILSEKDDIKFVQRMEAYRFDPGDQVKTEALTKSGLLRKLVAEAPQVRASWKK